MKKYLYIVFTVVFFVVMFFILQNGKSAPEEIIVDNEPVVIKDGIELCFAKFGPKQDSGFYDKYTLRMKLSGAGGSIAEGELQLLPAEKDSAIGFFTGTAGPVDRSAMARTADLWWDREGEGQKNKEQLRIIFGEGTASIGFGEMVDRGDGVYVYKDLSKVDYSFNLSDVSCEDLTERENVEKYLWGNIKTLSPVSAVLGGSWYVVSADIDLEKNSGTVIYEDGHVQEKRVFNYETSNLGEVVNLKIN